MSPRAVAHLAAMACCLLGGGARAGGRGADVAEVVAAASLAEVLPRIAAARGLAGRVAFRFDASSRLARQIEEGLPADVFVSADAEWMDHLERLGRLAPGTRREVIANRLVVVVPAGSEAAPGQPSDLASPSVARLALAGEAVPAGRYARAALRAAGVLGAVEKRVVSGDSVRTALAWVARGEAAAGIVYASDARAEPRVKVAFVFPAESHPPIVYVAAAIAGGAPAHREAASALLEALGGAEARAILEQAGFRALSAPAR